MADTNNVNGSKPNGKIITRGEYLSGKYSHSEYYGQYVTQREINILKMHISEDEIKASNDPDFNDIPLKRWDALPATHHIGQTAKQCGTWVTLAKIVCVYKEAARQIKSEVIT